MAESKKVPTESSLRRMAESYALKANTGAGDEKILDRPKAVAWANRLTAATMPAVFYDAMKEQRSELAEGFFPLYDASAIKWWLERAAREIHTKVRSERPPEDSWEAGYQTACDEMEAAIRKLIGEVE